jgi:hypothetical protein
MASVWPVMPLVAADHHEQGLLLVLRLLPRPRDLVEHRLPGRDPGLVRHQVPHVGLDPLPDPLVGVHGGVAVVEDADRVGGVALLRDEGAVAAEPRPPLHERHDVVARALRGLVGRAAELGPADHDVHGPRLPGSPVHPEAGASALRRSTDANARRGRGSEPDKPESDGFSGSAGAVGARWRRAAFVGRDRRGVAKARNPPAVAAFESDTWMLPALG